MQSLFSESLFIEKTSAYPMNTDAQEQIKGYGGAPMSKQQNTVDTQKNAKAQNAPRKQNGTRRPQPRPAKGSGAKKAAEVVISLALIAAVGFEAWRVYRNLIPIAQTGDHLAVDLTAEQATEAPTEAPIIYQNISISNSEIHAGDLILVNNKNAYVENNVAEIVSIYENKTDSYHVSGTETSLRKPALDAFNELIHGFYVATGHDDIIVISGYRTNEQQQRLYDEDLAQTGAETSTRVALPGHSEHESGYALDLSLYQDGVQLDYDGTGEYSWINENCANYGYILRYAANKVEETEIQAEPWHYRYVGQPHASYIMENNICLEEYLTLLKNYDNENPLRITNWDGEIYAVYYVPADAASDMTYVLVPPDGDYTISGNNSDGFIVTVDTGEIQQFDGSAENATENPEAQSNTEAPTEAEATDHTE